MYARLDGSPEAGLETSPWKLAAHEPSQYSGTRSLHLAVIFAVSALFSRSRRSCSVGLFVLAILPVVDLRGTFRVGL